MKKILKKILPQQFILQLKSTAIAFESKVFPLFASNGFFASFYYCFFSTKFYREHKAVLQGRVQYEKSLTEIKRSSILLRRNTHRLEKCLIMEPQKPVFAEAYIEETIDCYEKCLKAETICQDELKWAQDVLEKYFSIVGSSEVIDKTKEQFLNLPLLQENERSDEQFLPYEYSQRTVSSISQDELHNLFKQRRSIRWYETKEVELHLIEKAVEMASQAPSACNRQPFEFYTITDSDKATKIAKIAGGTTGFAENIPALIAIIGDLSSYPKERDRHLVYIDGGLAAMQLMLAFESLGLSTCPINFPDIESAERKLAEQLELSPYHRPVMLLSVGYGKAAGKIPYSQKKSAKQLIKEIQ